MMNRVLTALAVLAILNATAHAQHSKAQDDADLKEIQSYTLTMPVLQKMVAATNTFVAALQNDPRYRDYATAQKELNALNKKEDRTDAEDARIEKLEQQIETMKKPEDDFKTPDNPSLGEMESVYAKVPHLTEALRSVGLTPREYAKFVLCAFQAGMVAGMQKSGVAMKLPDGVQPANVQFMKDHEKDFTALQSAMQPGK